MKVKPNKPTAPASWGLKKRSISAPQELFKAADEVMKGRMIDTFSEYVRTLIRRDLDKKKAA